MRAVKIPLLQKRDSFSPTVTFLILSNTLASVTIWHTAKFLAYLDILSSYMKEMRAGHSISGSVIVQATHRYQVGGAGEALKA